ncbi:MAG TPA: sigma factor-like helix-turn-helix DNA-binding protein [Thermoguttaceae bacterium]|nr:sigma factor-like helix-turn-helix DNA-binding protein [Thermoguttaceae bacterium]
MVEESDGSTGDSDSGRTIHGPEVIMTRNQYPRRGQRIAPAALRELLQVPVPSEFLGEDTEFLGADMADGLLLCDLDETAWDRFDADTCRELARHILREVSHAIRSSTTLGNHPIPTIPDGMTLAELGLEVRTINCLVAAGIHERPQDLQKMTVEGILGLRGFWVKSLIDLLVSLEYAIDHPEAADQRQAAGIAANKHFRTVHRYPRLNHRLAPQTLREVLSERAPGSLVGGTRFSNARLCDLDGTVWDHLSAETIGRLADMVVARADAVVHNRTIMQRRLPQPPEGLRLEQLCLENRTHNCLQRAGYDGLLKGLGELTVADVLGMRAFGVKCLVDLLTSLETHMVREGQLDSELTAEAMALSQMAEVVELPFTDPRLGPLLRAIDTESNTVGELADRLLKRRHDPPNAIRLAQQIREFREQVAHLTGLLLEDELVQIFVPTYKSRDQQIVAEYYGWDGQGGRTLEELGCKYDLSRERIRQVCVRAIKQIRDTVVFAPVLDRALAFFASRFPVDLEQLQIEFDATGLSQCGLTIESVQHAAKFLSAKPDFAIIDLGRSRMAVAPHQVEMPRAIVHAAKQVVSNFGAARVAEVASELAIRFERRIDPTLIRATLQTQKDFHWLDARHTWFRLATLPQYGLPNMIEKILSVAGRIDATTMRAAMMRYRRNERTLPPTSILLEFCGQMPNVRIEDNTIISDPPRDWRETLAGVERGMVEVLNQHGPIMERGDFEDRCIAGGMNPFSFNAIVMCSPVISQYGRSVYGLLGLKVDRKTLDAIAEKRADGQPPQVLHAYGQTTDGKSYLAYRLSKAAISGGVITVPAAMKRRVRGKFTLRTDQGHDVGTLVARKGCGWGLGPALRGSDAKQGDHMLLLFDTDKRNAQIHLGDESILKDVVDS